MQTLIEIILLWAALFGLICIVLATVYDIKRLHVETSLRREMRRMTKHKQPHVSIIISETTGSDQLLQCLRHIKKSHYTRYDVVAVMRAAGAHERQSLKDASRIEAFCTYIPRRTTNDSSILKNAYARSRHGELVLVLSDQDLLESTAIKKSVALLRQVDLLDGIKLFGELEEPISMVQLYAAFSQLNNRFITKALNRVKRNGYYMQAGPVIYKYDSMVKAAKSGSWNMHITYQHGLLKGLVRMYPADIRWYEWVLRLIFVTIVAYVCVIAAALQSAWPFLMGWLVVSLWLVAIVWSDETLRIGRKIMISLTIPFGMFVVAASYTVSGVMAMLRVKTI